MFISNDQNIRLFVVDSPYLKSIDLQSVAEKMPNIDVVSRLHNCGAAISLVQSLCPDVVLLDLDQECIENAESFVKANGGINVVTFADDCDAFSLTRLLRCGVRAYCRKDADLEKLYLALVTACKGDLWLDASFASKIATHAESNGGGNGNQPSDNGDLSRRLSNRDREILRMVANGATNREIAAHLFLSISTIKADLHRMVELFKVKDRTQAAVFAATHGLLSA